MNKIKRMTILASFVLLAVFSVSVVQPVGSASATGYEAYPEWGEIQSGEALRIYSVDPCPVVDYLGLERVWATVYQDDISGPVELFSADIAFPDELGNWEYGIIKFQDPLDEGTYSVVVECRAEDDSTIKRSYESFTVDVVEHNDSQIYVNKTDWYGISVVESLVPCAPFDEVEVRVYGGTPMPQIPGNTMLTAELVQTVTADSFGDWYAVFHLVQGPEMDLGFTGPGGTYFIRATCNGVSDLVYDSYKFVLGKAEYVALGDSYSAGTGSFNYDLSSYCYRSTDNYAYGVYSGTNFLNEPEVLACNGAVTYNVLNTTAYLEAQIDFLSWETKVVTLTIGGNDAGFAHVLDQCIERPSIVSIGWGCSADTDLTDGVADRLLALDGEYVGVINPLGNPSYSVESITGVLSEIKAAAPNARVYIVGYPRLIDVETTYWDVDLSAPGGYTCTVGHHPVAGDLTIAYSDAAWIINTVVALNYIIREAALAEGAFYVAPTSFYGHGVCGWDDPWVNSLLLDGTDVLPESFHPNVDGMMYGYAEPLISAMTESD